MVELFTDISESFKKRMAFIIDMAFRQETKLKAMQVIKNFSQYCSEREKNFIDFYLKIKMENFRNEDNLN